MAGKIVGVSFSAWQLSLFTRLALKAVMSKSVVEQTG